MKTHKLLVVSILVVVTLLGTSISSFAGPMQQEGKLQPVVRFDEHHDLSPALRSIAPAPAIVQVEREPGKVRRLPGVPVADPVLQDEVLPNAMPAPIQNFDGVNNINGVLPPDTQGNVGPNHYVQWVNSSFQIFSKTGTPLYGPVNGNTLFSGFGGPCETTNDGDPITLYDKFADRWVMTQFGNAFTNGPFYECIAVSQTPDPTGAWYRYAFLINNTKLDDYPKLGVWPDGYYMSINQFVAPALSWGGQGVVAFERSQMLTGAAAQMVYFDLYSVNPNYGGAIVADFDGTRPPQAGEPMYFIEDDESTWMGDPYDTMRVWEFHVDWTTPANSTYGVNGDPNYMLQEADWTPLPCVAAGTGCIPQPGTTRKLQGLADRLMYRLAYRNFGDYRSMTVSHTVLADGTDRAGVRWYELRNTGSGWTIYQQSTYAPADGLYRWMPSIAQDHNGNMAVGFSTSNGTAPNYPSIAYAGRLATDPLGVMAQGEAQMFAGTGSQTHSAERWGDYSAMTIDPVDDCTFWYTQEYIQTTGSAPWRTRIASFRFPSCVNPTSVDVSNVSAATSAAAYAPFAALGLVALAAVVLALRARRS